MGLHCKPSRTRLMTVYNATNVRRLWLRVSQCDTVDLLIDIISL